jgi:hypothetical protein
MMTTTNKKQKKLCVTFDTNITIAETYSSEEYDRSDIFSSTLYKINSSRLPQLSLTITTPSLTYDDDDSSSTETSPIISPLYKKSKKKPMLSIDTSVCSDPLFFSRLTTNYKSDNVENDYLVPLSIV